MTIRVDPIDRRLFRQYFTTHPTYRHYLLVPERGWSLVRSADESETGVFRYAKAFAIVYPNGHVFDIQGRFTSPPPGTAGLDYSRKVIPAALSLEDLTLGSNYLRVVHEPSPAPRPGKPGYRTVITNISDQAVTVTKFGSFQRRESEFRLTTITGEFYTNSDFCLWYGLKGDALGPGESGSHAGNWGGDPDCDMLWAYFCESEDGAEFVAGAVVDFKRIWK